MDRMIRSLTVVIAATALAWIMIWLAGVTSLWVAATVTSVVNVGAVYFLLATWWQNSQETSVPPQEGPREDA